METHIEVYVVIDKGIDNEVAKEIREATRKMLYTRAKQSQPSGSAAA